jgi:hypothetical protein
MRTDIEILTELEAQREQYRANVDKWKRSQIEESNLKVKALMTELNDYYTQGAIMPDNVAPYAIGGIYGMKRANSQYEVGISAVTVKAGMAGVAGLFSRGTTRDEAVANWNGGRYAS